jgi:hypothetical protein
MESETRVARRKQTRRKRTDTASYSGVAKSPFLQEIEDCLKSGWSAAAVRNWLQARYPGAEVPSVKSIQRYRQKHFTVIDVLPPALIMEKLKEVDYKVNLLGLLSRLIPLLEDRLCRGLQLETDMQGILLPSVDRAIESYLDALREWKAAAQALGELPPPPPPLVDMRTQQLVINDPEVAEAVKELRDLAQRVLQERGGV